MCAATSALITLEHMGYSLSIPDWFLFIVLLSVSISSLCILFKFIYSFKSSAPADDK